MIGLIVWCIIFIVIAACLLPWWFLPVTVGYFILVEILKDVKFSRPRKAKPQDSMPHLEKVKREIEQQKKVEAIKEQNRKDRNTKTNPNRSKANIAAGTCYQKNDNFDYDRYIAAKKEEQAAYDDFIASMDMDD